MPRKMIIQLGRTLSQAKPPALRDVWDEGPGPTQSQGALLQHRESLMDGRIWTGALFLAAIPAFPRKGENSHGASRVPQFLSRVVTDTTTRSHQ